MTSAPKSDMTIVATEPAMPKLKVQYRDAFEKLLHLVSWSP